MKIKELISHLSQFDGELDVFYPGKHAGYSNRLRPIVNSRLCYQEPNTGFWNPNKRILSSDLDDSVDAAKFIPLIQEVLVISGDPVINN